MKRLVGLILLWLLLCGCSDADLEQKMAQQSAELEKVKTRLGKVEWQLRTQLLAPALTFRTEQLQFSLDDRHFEPQVMGQVVVQAGGETVPPLLYAEVEVVVDWPGNAVPLRQTTLLRMEKGRAELPLLMPIPTHSVSEQDIRVQVNVLGWTLGYPAAG